MSNRYLIPLLLALLLLTPAFGPAKEQAGESVTLIVRFTDDVDLDQAKAKIKEAGAQFAEVVSAERRTYEATTDTEEACTKAIKTLNADKQVVFAESEKDFSANKKRRDARTVGRSASGKPSL